MAASSNNTEAKTEAKTEKVVRYVGTSDERRISKRDWASIGVEDQDATVWDARNGHKLPASSFSKDALAYFEKDSGFKVEEA